MVIDINQNIPNINRYFSNILQHLGNIQLVIHCNTLDHSLTFRHSVSLDHSAILTEEMPLFSARILILG